MVGGGLLLLAIVFRFEMESPQVSKPISLPKKEIVAKTDLPKTDIAQNEVGNAPPRGANPFMEKVLEATDPSNIAKSKEAIRRNEFRRIFEEARAEVEAETGIKLFDPNRRPSWEEQMNWNREEYLAYQKKHNEFNSMDALRMASERAFNRKLQSPEDQMLPGEREMLEESLQRVERINESRERSKQYFRELIANQEVRIMAMSDEEWVEWNRDRVDRLKAFSEAAERGEEREFVREQMQVMREEISF